MSATDAVKMQNTTHFLLLLLRLLRVTSACVAAKPVRCFRRLSSKAKCRSSFRRKASPSASASFLDVISVKNLNILKGLETNDLLLKDFNLASVRFNPMQCT